MLGLGYASIFACFLGNLTLRESSHFDNTNYEYFTSYLSRKYILSIENDRYDSAIPLRNLFGDLHCLSCGSRGIEPFHFDKFISVFERQIWHCICISITLLATAFVKMYQNKFNSITFSTGTLSVFKVLLKQGDPFPPYLDKCINMRLLMSGVFLAGIVISNAFKSENVYKIVLPRLQISYYNVDELIEDDITWRRSPNLVTRL